MDKNQDHSLDREASELPTRAILWRGVRGYCPQCGKGNLFRSYLKQVDACAECGEDTGDLRADDAPAWLTILIIGHILAPFIVSLALDDTLPLWLLLAFLFIFILALVLLLLPRSKGLFIAALWVIHRRKIAPKHEKN